MQLGRLLDAVLGHPETFATGFDDHPEQKARAPRAQSSLPVFTI
jgi:hypothetical protein